ncbi:MAG: chorismate synthase [Anaerolineaceae bacterium]|nr:chorismate synthase [Anaerolineaceae bacterium]
MIRLLTAGESHGPAVTTILEGIPAGLRLAPDDINHDLARRQKGFGSGGRMKIEKDQVQILSGVMSGITVGSPISLQINNLDHVKWKDKAVPALTTPRPGHADLTGAIKYGYNDLRYSLERASARETTARVAAASVCRKLLNEFGIKIGSYVTEIGSIKAQVDDIPIEQRISLSEQSDVRCPDDKASEDMRQHIRKIMQDKDTLGGVFEVVALGVPPGLGSYVHWDRKIEAILAKAILSIHAIKGVEIGPAFDNSRKRGTEVHDEIILEGDSITRNTNRAGGTEGGVTTGQPLVLRAAMKPISTTLNPLQTVDLATGKPGPTTYERSDFCAVPRAAVVGEAMVAFVLADELLRKIGGDSLNEMHPRFNALPQASLNDITINNEPTIFW